MIFATRKAMGKFKMSESAVDNIDEILFLMFALFK